MCESSSMYFRNSYSLLNNFDLLQAFSSLAEAAYDNVETPEDASEPPTYCLSNYFEPIVQKLLETTDRTDGNQHNLRSAAYEALMELVKNSPKVSI